MYVNQISPNIWVLNLYIKNISILIKHGILYEKYNLTNKSIIFYQLKFLIWIHYNIMLILFTPKTDDSVEKLTN
jgi:hypothetical protein